MVGEREGEWGRCRLLKYMHFTKRVLCINGFCNDLNKGSVDLGHPAST